MEDGPAIETTIRKRKADRDEPNERLSKVSRRLSQLNLDTNGGRVASPARRSPRPQPTTNSNNEMMQMDDSPYKVYIYNLDDELSDSDSSVDENRLIFLPDIDKKLRQSRIPPLVLANADGELAGRNLNNELVLYNVPTSLSVPEGQDSVRKAIIETRARAREKARREQEKARTAPITLGLEKFTNGVIGGHRPPFARTDASTDVIPGHQQLYPGHEELQAAADDYDAMDLS